jgi:hypothetical protein
MTTWTRHHMTIWTKTTHDNPMLASAPLLPSILPRMKLVSPLVYTTLVKPSTPWNRWPACIYAFASLGDVALVPASLFLLTNRRPPRIMIRSSMPKITASVTIAPITPATSNDMLVLDEDPVTVLLLFASPSASGLHKPVVLPQA